ncbi:MAG TPA: Holliday junction resolvase RuvX [Acidimicrobiales bacterium]|nr:Holliday junction resolvase RuvX [Acidimicrobiales bacterium]
MGIDLGTRRIGLAISDEGGRLATPAGTVERSGDRAADHARLAAAAAELGAEEVVVGLPLSLSGALGPAARSALGEVEELRSALGVPIHTQDERFTTVTAARALRETGGGRRRRAPKGAVDEAAAAVLLQAWLDAGSRR